MSQSKLTKTADFKLRSQNVVVLAGGVGGAKMATGLQQIVEPGRLTVVVNTADDFDHWGVTICPDLDTVMYNLAGVHNPEQGWGRANESFRTMETMSQIGGEDWFLLGDQDMAVHLRRSEWLRHGISLSEVTERLRRSFGIPSTILPMSDHQVRTLVHTEEGDMPFQHYFVRKRCEPAVIDISFVGSEQATASPKLLNAIEMADAIVIAPSNPYLSVDPILTVRGIRERLRTAAASIVAVSPIINGQAVKGPAAKLMSELGHLPSAATIAEHYGKLLDGFVLDQQDEELEGLITVPTLVTDTIMKTIDDKATLALQTLNFVQMLSDRFPGEQIDGIEGNPFTGSSAAPIV